MRAACSLILPAPTSRIAQPARSPKTCSRERRRGGRDRGRALADRRLRAHLASRVERLAEDAVEQRPGRAGLVRGAHLAEDLALARDERVEPGGDAEEVQRGRLVAQAVERRLDRRARARRAPRPPRARRRRRPSRARYSSVRLQVERHTASPPSAEPLERAPRARAVERDPLPQLDRSVLVRGADEDERITRSGVTGRREAHERSTSAKPASARYAARRPVQPRARAATR